MNIVVFIIIVLALTGLLAFEVISLIKTIKKRKQVRKDLDSKKGE